MSEVSMSERLITLNKLDSLTKEVAALQAWKEEVEPIIAWAKAKKRREDKDRNYESTSSGTMLPFGTKK